MLIVSGLRDAVKSPACLIYLFVRSSSCLNGCRNRNRSRQVGAPCPGVERPRWFRQRRTNPAAGAAAAAFGGLADRPRGRIFLLARASETDLEQMRPTEAQCLSPDRSNCQ